MPSLRSWVFLLAAVALAGCERARVAPPIDSTVPVVGATTQVTPVQAGAAWDAALGPMLVVGGDTPATAAVLTPDSSTDSSSSLSGTQLLLLGRGGSTQRAALVDLASRPEETCAGLVLWRLDAAEGSLAPWAVGIATGEGVEPVSMDSVESMTPADSADLAAQMTRLASTLGGSSSERLSGLPFTVQSIWRFSPEPGVQAVAASLIRSLNVEANPLEERTLLVAERPVGGKFQVGYHERSEGTEESVESREIIGAIRLGRAGRVAVVIARDFENATAYSLIERTAPGVWRLRWTSRRVRC